MLHGTFGPIEYGLCLIHQIDELSHRHSREPVPPAINEWWQNGQSPLKIKWPPRINHMSRLPQELRIGVPSIDREHLELVTLLDNLTNDPSVHLESESFSELISRLGNLVNGHFSNEETFLRSCGMPLDEVAAHVEAHHEILYQYAQLNYARIGNNDLALSKVTKMVNEWIVAHLLNYDVKIRRYAPA